MKSDIDTIINQILKFRDERDWEQFHDGKNLAMCLNIEASELLELYLWKNNDEINIDRLKEELADVFYSAFLLAHKYNLNIKEIISDKLEINAAKYPVSKSKGSNKKYTQFDNNENK